MTTQIALKLPEELVEAVDRLVRQGEYVSRSDAVRAGISLVLDEANRRAVERAFAEGFRRSPETPDEVADATRLAVEAIADEPWEPWW